LRRQHALKKALPIKDWENANDIQDKSTLGSVEDYLYNDDLANELKTDGREIDANLQVLHDGMKVHSCEYDYCTATDSEGGILEWHG
jgi:hypothetical protein